MQIKQLRLATFLIVTGIIVFGAGLIADLAELYPYIDSALRTHQIPVAPQLAAAQPDSTAAPLLPFTNGDEPAMVVTATPSASPTPFTPTPLPLPPTPLPAEQSSPPPTPTALPPTPTPLPVERSSPTPTPLFSGTAPTRLRIPALRLDAPVIATEVETVDVNGQLQAIWKVPDYKAAGWHNTSALLHAGGNTVLNGHNTTKGEVFRDLYKLNPGALILVDGENGETYAYTVREMYILPEAGQPLEVRLRNAQYIQPTADERLTLVTCHPYGSLRNRLVVIAFPNSLPDTIPEGD